jgi:N-acetyltransferase
VITVQPISLEGLGVRLEPLTLDHHDELAAAAADGKLWELWFTAVPEPDRTEAYIRTALAGQQEGHRLPWAVRDTVMYSILAIEWSNVKRHLELRLARHGANAPDAFR